MTTKPSLSIQGSSRPRAASSAPHVNFLRKSFTFSLVELLLVLAILSILLSLLSPALQKAMDGSQSIVCAKNQNEVLNIVLAYAEDHEQQLPIAYNKSTLISQKLITQFPAFKEGVYTVELTHKGFMSLQDMELNNCPKNNYTNYSKNNALRYLYSSNLGYHSSKQQPLHPIFNNRLRLHRIDEIAHPESQLSFMDATGWFSQKTRCDYYVNESTYDKTGGFELHADGSRVQFLDGHNEVVPLPLFEKEWLKFQPQ